MALPPFATVILFALFLPTLYSTLPSSFLRWQRAVPILKNKAKRHYTPTTTTVPFMPVCKSAEAKLHNVAL
jgi:hypothetical protein